MRLTDDRYSGEKSQFELALRMIRHEARTRTIRECTGLSDDRIRKVYATYFRDSGKCEIKRRRGKSPQQITRFVKNSQNQIQATTLVTLFCAGLLIRIDDDASVHPCWPRPSVELGHRLCRAYENFLQLHKNPQLNFEWTWNLLQSISYSDELYLASCKHCATLYVQDAYALNTGSCPTCETVQQRDH